MTSQAISESASNIPAVPKLCTWRLQLPAPRSSTATSAAATRRLGNDSLALAPQIANRPSPEIGSLLDAEVDHVGRAVENRSAGRQLERRAIALDGSTAGQRQDHHLGAAGVKLRALGVVEFEHLQ